jgi:hypothetical protein
MRKSISIIMAVLLLAGLLISCSSTAWTENPYGSFPQSDYVCAVGRGKNADEADLAARKELASLFGMTVQATVSRTILETSMNRDGNKSDSFGEFFTSTASMNVTADNLYGVEIAKRTSEKDGTCISLAVMERKVTTDFYLARLKSDGEEIQFLKASIPSLIGTMKAVEDATSLVRKSNDYNTSVVMCNYLSGKEIPFVSLAEGYELHKKAREAVVLEINVEGDDSGAVKSAVSKIFTDAGLAVSNGTKTPTAKADVSIVWRESAGTGVASSFIFADYNADVSVIDLAGNQTLLVFSAKGKEGHQSYEGAKARATTALVNTIEGNFRAQFADTFAY